MLKYYYIKRTGKSQYTDSELLDNNAVYIVDTTNTLMMNILDEIIEIQQAEVNDRSYTDEESEDVELSKNNGTEIILENKSYTQDTKLIKKIKKIKNILFLADYNEHYIPLITWLMNTNTTICKYPEKHIIKTIDFLSFQIQQKIYTNNNTEIKKDIITIHNGNYHIDNNDLDFYTHIKTFIQNYQLKNDKYFQYFQTSISRYESFIDSLEWLPNHTEYLQINTPIFNHSLSSLPDALKYLHIKSGNFNQPIDNLPHNLEYLAINCSEFNQEVSLLPPNLKYLYINSESFNQEINNLPINLDVLQIDSNTFIHTFDNLPHNLKSLHISIYSNTQNNYKNDIMDFTNLPNSLEYLFVNTWLPCSTTKLIIPTNLKEIYFPYMDIDGLLEKNQHLKKYNSHTRNQHDIMMQF